MNPTPPPEHVRVAFGATGAIEPTRSSDVWRAGAMALKRVGHEAAAEWVCGLLATRAPAAGFRIPSPVAATDGRWVVDGWAASTWIRGREDGSRWREILDASTRFHEWLADVERPAWLDDVDDPWRVSDRMAWGGQAVEVRPEFLPLVEQLVSIHIPVTATSQLVHGDLAGNVLFAPGRAPGIIDLSLYWRPAGYAVAIVAVDCFEWEGVGAEVLDHVAALPDGFQLLVRAAMFRIVRSGMVQGADARNRLSVHARTVSAIASRI